MVSKLHHNISHGSQSDISWCMAYDVSPDICLLISIYIQHKHLLNYHLCVCIIIICLCRTTAGTANATVAKRTNIKSSNTWLIHSKKRSFVRCQVHRWPMVSIICWGRFKNDGPFKTIWMWLKPSGLSESCWARFEAEKRHNNVVLTLSNWLVLLARIV